MYPTTIMSMEITDWYIVHKHRHRRFSVDTLRHHHAQLFQEKAMYTLHLLKHFSVYQHFQCIHVFECTPFTNICPNWNSLQLLSWRLPVSDWLGALGPSGQNPSWYLFDLWTKPLWKLSQQLVEIVHNLHPFQPIGYNHWATSIIHWCRKKESSSPIEPSGKMWEVARTTML